jgi:translation initiation factor IF-3
MASKVRLIDEKGQQTGIVSIQEAKNLAKNAELDLVEIVPDAKPPVVKILNYSKFRYDQAHKARVNKKRQTNTEVKEIRFRLKIESHDYEIKKKRVIKFLEGGDKVKVGIMFRGREQSHPERGAELLDNIAKEIGDIATIETEPSHEGRNMTMVLAPVVKKVATISEQRRRGAAKKLTRLDRIKKRALKRKEAENAKK